MEHQTTIHQERLVSKYLKKLQKSAPLQVLEIGAHRGLCSYKLAKKYPNIQFTCIDPYPEQIYNASNLHFFKGNFPFNTKQKYDMIIAFYVFDSYDNCNHRFINSISERLNKNGLAIVTAPDYIITQPRLNDFSHNKKIQEQIVQAKNLIPDLVKRIADDLPNDIKQNNRANFITTLENHYRKSKKNKILASIFEKIIDKTTTKSKTLFHFAGFEVKERIRAFRKLEVFFNTELLKIKYKNSSYVLQKKKDRKVRFEFYSVGLALEWIIQQLFKK